MIKHALIALALLVSSPAIADTIYIDYDVYTQAVAELQANLTRDGFYGPVPGCSFECTIQKPMLWSIDYTIFYDATGFLPNDRNFVVVGVPEPATAVLMSFALLLVMLPRKLLWRQ